MRDLVQYLMAYNIRCEALEGGCNNKNRVQKIAEMINDIDKGKVHLPLDEKKLGAIEECVEEMTESKFYPLQQKVIYRLLTIYGFKENRIINLMKDSFDIQNKTLSIQNDVYDIILELNETIYYDLLRLCDIHKYKEREYLFTNTKGKKLTPSSVFPSLKEKTNKKGIKDFCPTTVGLSGVARLIDKNLSVSEINIFTGFDAEKIKEVADYILLDKDISKIINEKITTLPQNS